MLEIEPPKTHDLDLLVSLLPEDCTLSEDLGDLAELSQWAVESRYPGDWPEAGAEDAKDAVDQAEAILERVLDDLPEHGFDMPKLRT